MQERKRDREGSRVRVVRKRGCLRGPGECVEGYRTKDRGGCLGGEVAREGNTMIKIIFF